MSRNITIMASLLLLFVLLSATFYLYGPGRLPSIVAYHQESATDFGHELEASFMRESAQKEWKWLYKYHGNPTVVIYEESKTPYFFDKQGNKCAFVNPSKRNGEMNDRTDEDEHFAELKLNTEDR